MSTTAFSQIRTAVHQLNPGAVREEAERPLSIGLEAGSSETLAAMEDFLAPPGLSRRRRLQLFEGLHRIGDPGTPPSFDIVLSEEPLAGRLGASGAEALLGYEGQHGQSRVTGEPLPEAPGAFPFFAGDPKRTVREILRERGDLRLPLARRFPPFRQPVIHGIIQDVAQENALFALFSALPDVLPNVFALGWAVAEFASDTAVLTVNQVRMAFLIAAASDRPVSFLDQKRQVASIVAGAFGWRAMARELAGKIPFGGGLIPKAAISYAGTYVVGLSLERFYRIGYGMTAGEREGVYREALANGKRFAGWALEARRRIGRT
jgi:hypothetical protein